MAAFSTPLHPTKGVDRVKPIHPMFVHFPIALLALSAAPDVVAFFLKIDSLKSAGWWALAGATAGGVVAVAAGRSR